MILTFLFASLPLVNKVEDSPNGPFYHTTQEHVGKPMVAKGETEEKAQGYMNSLTEALGRTDVWETCSVTNKGDHDLQSFYRDVTKKQITVKHYYKARWYITLLAGVENESDISAKALTDLVESYRRAKDNNLFATPYKRNSSDEKISSANKKDGKEYLYITLLAGVENESRGLEALSTLSECYRDTKENNPHDKTLFPETTDGELREEEVQGSDGRKDIAIFDQQGICLGASTKTPEVPSTSYPEECYSGASMRMPEDSPMYGANDPACHASSPYIGASISVGGPEENEFSGASSILPTNNVPPEIY